MIDIGYLLKELRTENGFTQGKLAKRLGVSVTTIGTWESGAKLPSIDRLTELSRLYHVPLNYIAGIDKEKSIVLNMTLPQQNLLKTLVLEFQDRGNHNHLPGLSDRQKDILSDLLIEFKRN